MTTTQTNDTTTKPDPYKRDGVLVRFIFPFGIYQPGDEALFDTSEAILLCGIEEGRPKGNPKAVGKMIGYNKGGQHYKAESLPD